MTGEGAGALVLHATTVAIAGKALVLTGPSGAGKSALGLQMMALGAALVADDRTRITLRAGSPWADAPPGLPAAIEARHLGLLSVPTLAPAAPVALVVDLGQVETHRLPPPRKTVILGVALPLVFRVEGPHFPAALLHHLRHGTLI